MKKLHRTLDRRLNGARRVEPFVRRIVVGGIALVTGLWLVHFGVRGGVGWLSGLGLVALGILALKTGIWSKIDV